MSVRWAMRHVLYWVTMTSICEQPHIAPGNDYQYTSGAVIETPLGTMEGHYEMVDEQGNAFRVAIPVFRLAVPTLIH